MGLGRDPEDQLGPEVLDAALDAIVSIDEAGNIVQFNRRATEMFGYARAEAIGRPLADLIIPPDLRDAHWAGLERVISGGSPHILDRRVELRALGRDGKQFPVELAVTRTGRSPDRFTGFVRDLTPLKEAEDRRTDMEGILAAAEELAHVGSFRADLATGHTVWSDELYRIYGLEPGTPVPPLHRLPELVHPDDHERIAGMLETLVARAEEQPGATEEAEFRVLRPDGSVRELLACGRIEADEEGRPAVIVGSAQDLTDQRRTERELSAHYALDQALKEWESVDEGVVGLVQRLGEALDYALGAMWTWDEGSERLTCRVFWTAHGVDGGDFEVLSRRISFRPGEGVPGRVWQSRVPMAGARENLRAERRTAAEALGLQSGIAFPALAPDGPVAVLSYYSPDVREVSERTVRTLTGLGSQLGRFLAARRLELGPQLLSPREVEVLRLAAEGNTGPEIAESLVVSPATVKTHFEHVYEKLGVSDRAAAVAHAMRTGLID